MKKIYVMVAVMAIASSVYAFFSQEQVQFCSTGTGGVCVFNGSGFDCAKGNDPERNGDCSGVYEKEVL